jgi:aryl-alcohol dehydrogenase-like predicted oxidoreductase
MRLSTEPDRDEARAIDVLHAAFDAGVTLLDTADAYCRDAGEAGHNERLIARALATWGGDRSRIRVATKGGLTRPHGEWIADGRARHLAAACEASRRALGVDRIDLYQLHALDPRTPLATSVRALAALQRDGLIAHVGLCNVNVGQIEEARRITDIAAVQVELSVWHDDHVLGGVAAYCVANGIRLIAYRPLGGPQRRRRTLSDPALMEVAARHGATTFEIALAWLRDLADAVVPIPGPTQVATALSGARAHRIHFTDEDRRQLDERFPAGQVLRRSRATMARPAASPTEGEVVLIMGLPGAGKSTAAQSFVAEGYARLNRDEDGGFAARAAAGARSPHRVRLLADRPRQHLCLAEVARSLDPGGRETWTAGALRMARHHARRCPGERGAADRVHIRPAARPGRNAPGRQTGHQRVRSGRAVPVTSATWNRPMPPKASHESTRAPSRARRDPAFTNRAVIVWCDGVLTRGRGTLGSDPGSDPDSYQERGSALRRYADDGWRLLGLGWQPGRLTGDCHRRAGGRQLRENAGAARRRDGHSVLSPRRRPAGLLVPKAAAGPRRRADSAAPPRSVAVHLRWERSPGPRVRGGGSAFNIGSRRVLHERNGIAPGWRILEPSS